MTKHVMCIECKENVVWYYNSMFCKYCIVNFFEKDDKHGKKTA